MKKIIGGALVAAVALALPACATQNQHWESNCTVTSKDMIYGGDKDSGTTRTKRLSTSCGAFNVEDAWEVGAFNSYDLWAKLEVGKTYDLKVGGIRNGFMSMFQTVIEVKGPNG
ncbi:secreted protein [Mycobacterium phage Lolly9]|uniref:Uncharacterized protein n=1 Tax=Mycobacterium phage Lolly9 TaxID=1698711 RepID=A0A0K2FMN4_9CAUD|nr:secreted protein [Mycobacterium phage Lolly9]ALA48472.1 hypothetical protein LOLLY9_55 [Mycobacterium phage Lolly9]QOP65783.1 membrane protein [Mycobacterium phage MiniLon]QOP66530.1 hypothetical protein PBI_MINIMAC_59 [Mycobacterium phage MiniMac]